MNWDTVAGNWKQYKGKIREKWAFLSDDELEAIAGKRDALVGKIEEKYGMTKARVEESLDKFLEELGKAA
ncbi:MAG TPA: CsbD family protein [Candidatus Deferrimicrobiaceae bacterium]|nr:CsbD family protein [Candidatus Deferrimicrobiaceae bacterium]